LYNIIDEEVLGKETASAVVNKDEVEDIVINLKYALMQLNIIPSDIRGTFFQEFGEEDKISVYELTKVITRITKKSKEQTEKLAQYLVEHTDKYQEADIELACNKLCSILGDYTIPNESLKSAITRVIQIITSRS
jgi:hypothetical protein